MFGNNNSKPQEDESVFVGNGYLWKSGEGMTIKIDHNLIKESLTINEEGKIVLTLLVGQRKDGGHYVKQVESTPYEPKG